jgi:hypothetical protein
MIATENQLDRLANDLGRVAKEPVTVEQISGAIYAFGSELATLRIFAKYNANGANPNTKCRVGHSVNLGKFFFSIDV